jgi:hypothetical protein
MKKGLMAVLFVSLSLNALLGWLVLRVPRDRDHLISEIRRRESTMGDVVRVAKEIWPVRGTDAIERTIRDRHPRATITRSQAGPGQEVIMINDVRLDFYDDSLIVMSTVNPPLEYLETFR